MAPKKNATNNSAVNQPTVLPTRANPAVYLAASASVNVPSHPYGIRRKIWTLAQLYGQTLPVLNNPLYDAEEAPTMQTFSMSGSSEGGQLLKEPEGYSSGSFAHPHLEKVQLQKQARG